MYFKWNVVIFIESLLIFTHDYKKKRDQVCRSLKKKVYTFVDVVISEIKKNILIFIVTCILIPASTNK